MKMEILKILALNLALRFGRDIDTITTHEIDELLNSIENKNYSRELFKRIYEIEKRRKNISMRIGVLNEIENRVMNYNKGGFIED